MSREKSEYKGFNPIKEDKDGVRAKRMIWSSDAINIALKGLGDGRKLVANPFYENNTKILKGDLVFNRTEDEVEEWKKCANDIIYFSSKYCKLMTPEGIKSVTLRDYQVNYLKHLVDNRLSIYLACRQCGKTTTSALFLLWYSLFNVDKNALVLGNKRKTSIEILDKIKKIFLELPYFLKPGIYKWNEGEIVLDNGCRIMAEATTINSGISFTFHCVLADEFAHIQPNILDKFYNNLFPTITAGKARFMITSTQNGFNLFSRLYQAAVAGDNEYAPFKTDWYEVPEWNPETRQWEKRDEKWHKLQVANYGSEEAFNRQFGTMFESVSNSLISKSKLQQMELTAVKYINKDLGIRYEDSFFWHPDYNIENLKKDNIVITIDLAEGVSGDYTVCIINRITKTENSHVADCIGYFRNNELNIRIVSEIVKDFCVKKLDSLKYLVSVEYNMFGELFIHIIRELMNRDYLIDYDKFNEGNIVKYYSDDGSKWTYGVRMNSKNKLLAITDFKHKFEIGEINNSDIAFLNELKLFCDNKGNGTYQASYGHDDLVMAQLQICLLYKTSRFKQFLWMIDQVGESTENNSFNLYDVI